MLVKSDVQSYWFGAAVSFELIQFSMFYSNQYVVALLCVLMFI